MDPKQPASHRQSVQQLFVKHTVYLRALIRAFLPDFNSADDVLQESFLTVTAKADSFREGTNFLAWATAIVKFKLLEHQRERRSSEQALAPEVIETLCQAAPPPSGDDSQAMLAECLEELSPRAREALDIRYGEACKPTEVARRLNWKPEAVYVALSRARAVLRDCVERKIRQQGPG
jgi:RNA polymerase sigma-70 factor, ECF subfamily